MKNKNIIIVCVLFVIFCISGVLGYFLYTSRVVPKNAINIVMITSDIKYVYTKMEIQSLLDSKNPKTHYHLILITIGDNAYKRKYMKPFVKNVTLEKIKLPKSIVDLAKSGGIVKEENGSVEWANSYVCFIPNILPKKYKKVLYLNDKTIILKDLTDLYNTDVSQNYIAGVPRYYDQFKQVRVNYGVLLFNLEKWRKDKLEDKFVVAKDKYHITNVNFVFDAFTNVIPPDTVKHVSPIYYNTGYNEKEWSEQLHYIKKYPEVPQLSLDELDRDTVILFFRTRPSNTPNMKFEKKWWEYAHRLYPDWKYGESQVTVAQRYEKAYKKEIQNKKAFNKK